MPLRGDKRDGSNVPPEITLPNARPVPVPVEAPAHERAEAVEAEKAADLARIKAANDAREAETDRKARYQAQAARERAEAEETLSREKAELRAAIDKRYAEELEAEKAENARLKAACGFVAPVSLVPVRNGFGPGEPLHNGPAFLNASAVPVPESEPSWVDFA